MLKPLSPSEAAGYLGVCVDTLGRWRQHNIGPRYSKGPGFNSTIWYTIADLTTWLETHQIGTRPHTYPGGKKIIETTRLTVAQREALAPLFASGWPDTPESGITAVEAVLWLARTGRPRRELPPEFTPKGWAETSRAIARLHNRAIWPRVFEILSRDRAFRAHWRLTHMVAVDYRDGQSEWRGPPRQCVIASLDGDPEWGMAEVP